MLDWILPGILIAFGLGFLVANLRLVLEQLHYLRARTQARLVWPSRRPPYYGLYRPMGITLAVVVAFKLLVLHWPVLHTFGETMMFLYYACLLPLSLRVRRGFYDTGIWFDSGFLAYDAIGTITWKEGEELVLIVIPRRTQVARRLIVPSESFGEARRLLRDLIGAGTITFETTELRLGVSDDRDRA